MAEPPAKPQRTNLTFEQKSKSFHIKKEKRMLHKVILVFIFQMYGTLKQGDRQ
jgi:hypothetical protein